MTPTPPVPLLEPYAILRPATRWGGLDIREMWRFRDLLVTFALRDVKVRYKQTALGVVWVVLQPLVAAGIFSFVFGLIAKLEAPGGVPYFLFAFVGMQAWTLFSGTVTRATNSMVGNSNLVQKIYFPRLTLPLSTALTALLDFAVVSVVLGVLLVSVWHLPAWNALMIPVCVVLMLTLALGVGVLGSALAVPYRDVQYLLPVAIQFLLFASPVAYAVAGVPERYRALYYANPLAAVLETFRWAVLGVGEVPWPQLGYSAGATLLIFVVGLVAFRRMEGMFADVI